MNIGRITLTPRILASFSSKLKELQPDAEIVANLAQADGKGFHAFHSKDCRNQNPTGRPLFGEMMRSFRKAGASTGLFNTVEVLPSRTAPALEPSSLLEKPARMAYS